MKEQTLQHQANVNYSLIFDDAQRQLIDKAEKGDEEAQINIQEQVLETVLWATFHSIEEKQWHVVLGTGGPATQLVVTTDFSGNIKDVDFQYQDWFTPWCSAEGQDKELLTNFAELASFYEE